MKAFIHILRWGSILCGALCVVGVLWWLLGGALSVLRLTDCFTYVGGGAIAVSFVIWVASFHRTSRSRRQDLLSTGPDEASACDRQEGQDSRSDSERVLVPFLAGVLTVAIGWLVYWIGS